MKDKRTYYGAMDESSSDQQVYVNVLIFCIVRKAGPILPLLRVLWQIGSYPCIMHVCMQASRGAGRQADEILVGLKFLEFSTG